MFVESGETFLPSDWIVEQAWADKGPQSLQYPAAHAVPRLLNTVLGFKGNSGDPVCVRSLVVAQGVHWVPDVTRAAEEMAITEGHCLTHSESTSSAGLRLRLNVNRPFGSIIQCTGLKCTSVEFLPRAGSMRDKLASISRPPLIHSIGSNVPPGKQHLPRPSSEFHESRLVTKTGWIQHLGHNLPFQLLACNERPSIFEDILTIGLELSIYNVQIDSSLHFAKWYCDYLTHSHTRVAAIEPGKPLQSKTYPCSVNALL